VVDLVGEAVALQRFLETLHWRGGEEAYVDELLRSYAPRIQDARDFALSRRVLLLQSAAGIGIDLSLAALPFEDMTVSRSVLIELRPGAAIRLCSPEIWWL